MKPSNERLLIIGDSIALGITCISSDEKQTVTTHRRFVDQLREKLPGWEIEVDAAPGRTSVQATLLLPALIRQHQPHAVMIFLGGSDADINWKRFILTGGKSIRHNTRLDRFESNLRQLVREVQQAGACAILSDLPTQNLAERGRQLSASTGHDVTQMLQSANGEDENTQRHRLYAQPIEKVAVDTGSVVLRWTDSIAALPMEQRFGADAIHPGDAAYDIIADSLANLLRSLPKCDRSRPIAIARA